MSENALELNKTNGMVVLLTKVSLLKAVFIGFQYSSGIGEMTRPKIEGNVKQETNSSKSLKPLGMAEFTRHPRLFHLNGNKVGKKKFEDERKEGKEGKERSKKESKKGLCPEVAPGSGRKECLHGCKVISTTFQSHCTSSIS